MCPPVRTAGALALTTTLVAWSVVVAAQAPADPYAGCRERFHRAPQEYDSAYCFYRVTFERRLWAEGARVFEELIARHAGNSWLVLAYAHVHRTRDPNRAETLYRRAAEAFRQAGDLAGETEARSNLVNFLLPKGRPGDARRELERIVALGARTQDPLVKAQAWIVEAVHGQATGGDLGVAYRLLKQAQEILPANPPYLRERVLLIALGGAAFRMGRLEEALATYRRLEALALDRGEALVLANARYNILNTSEAIEAALPAPGARDRLVRMAEQSLATAIDAQNVDVTLKSHRMLADLLAADESSRGRALEHARQCLALSVTARQPADEAACAWIEAALQAPRDAREALASVRRARDATARDLNPRTQAHSAGRQMRLSWLTRSRDEAARDSLAAIDAIETLRALQDDPRSSADLFSAWTSDYYWLSGRLLQEDRPDLGLAFSIAERMRARALLDALDRSRQPLDASHPAVAERRAALTAIAAVQRILLDPALDDAHRATRLRELESLERREAEARRRIASIFPERRDASREFATLDAVQAALADDEALLSFQVGLWETWSGDSGGGSWLIAVSRDARTLHRLPDRARLAPVVPLFNGLLESGQGDAAAAAAALYDALLSGAIASLPPTVTRLVIVPDGALHHLPFEALRPGRDAPAIGARYEVVSAPSATLWLQWRRRPARTTTGRMLAVADPVLPRTAGLEASSRNATLLHGLRLGRLPHARDESDAIARHVGDVDLLVGATASERAVKSRDLRRYGLLHFAAHAIADEAHPERSAVLLAPGTPGEDGLLQAREIASLDLEGRIVVLSACRTAAGAVLSGEGVLSLARAFFEAGAHAVIGSRWPLRDADAAALFDTFYRHLASGASLSAALKATRDEAREDGRPASAWAGLVLLGNGDLRPFASRSALTPPRDADIVPIAVTLTLLVAAGIVLARRRAR